LGVDTAMMTERELLSRARFGISTLQEDIVIPALCEFLADQGFHDAARMLTIMECDYASQIESLNGEIEECETSIENLQEKVAELEKKLKKEPA
jgi:uncharacterized coiled-coil protein SlyX